MIVPSSLGGTTTEQVGFFMTTADTLARWIREGQGEHWQAMVPNWKRREDAFVALAPVPVVSRVACVPLGREWTVLFNNSPLGTDVGVLPSLAARELRIRTVRAVCRTADDDHYPARIFEFFGPDGSPPLAMERSIVAANDGGHWVFETSGTPLAFEDVAAYRLRRKSERVPPSALDVLHPESGYSSVFRAELE